MTLQSGLTLAPRAPLAAYRDDLARRGEGRTFGPSDATWLSLATILSHAVDVPAECRPPLLGTVREVIGGDPALRDVLRTAGDEVPPEFELDGVSPLVRAIVGRMEDEGALSLAYSTLAVLADADLRLSVLERGRVLAQLGRVAWKSGALDTAREQYRRVEVLGRTARSPELRVRAWVGYSIVARLRGNYPEVRKWAARAAHEADRAGLATLGTLAYHSLMVNAAVTGDSNGALVYGWHAYQCVVGDAAREAEALLNLSELLLRAGRPEVAAHGFAATLVRNPGARIALPALGGLALASSALGDRTGVCTALAQAESVIATAGLPYQSAAALLELSQALAAVGEAERGAECRALALDIANRHAYHEIVYRLEALAIAPDPGQAAAPHALDRHGTDVARAVAAIDLVGRCRRSLDDG
jgi:tetratricopeptide (TPR) repeat protein